jgi:hypothetical protein
VVEYSWRGRFTNADVNPLHAQAFGHRLLDEDWVAQLDRHSLGWVTAVEDGALVGFVNVAWMAGCTPSCWTPWCAPTAVAVGSGWPWSARP